MLPPIFRKIGHIDIIQQEKMSGFTFRGGELSDVEPARQGVNCYITSTAGPGTDHNCATFGTQNP